MKENKQAFRFIVVVFALCFTWFLIYDFWLNDIDTWLTNNIIKASVLFLQIIGYNATAKELFVQIDGNDTVYVYNACNGMVLMALFTGFVIAFPGPYLKKIIYIPAGIFIINMLNVIRISALALNAYYFQTSLNFNHKYTFTIILYVVILALWMLWVKKYSGLNKHGQKTKSKVQSA